MAMQFAALASRSVIRIGGPDAKSFLQGLISNDVENATAKRAIFATLLSAQGKIQFDFLVLKDHEDGYLLDVEAARLDELIKKLKLYRLRAKVTIEQFGEGISAAFGRDHMNTSDLEENPGWLIDPRNAQLGLRFYGAVEIAKAQTASESDYIAHRLSLGVPEGAQELGIEKLFLLEANAEELHGVDFKKGCYVGQELTARMKHKTELKKRLLPFRASRLPQPDAALMANGRELGNVVGGRSDVAFVLVRLDRLAEARSQSLTIGDQPATLITPAYLSSLKLSEA